MRKFIRNITRFSLPLLIICIIFFSMAVYRANYEINNKRQFKQHYAEARLDSLKQVKNKIIIIGGSNILFGVDPYLLEELTHKKVVNFAHIRTDGVENMLRLAHKVHHEGDMILLGLEYGGRSMSTSGRLLKYHLTGNPFSLIDVGDFKKLIVEEDIISTPKDSVRNSVYDTYDINFFLTGLDTIDVNYHYVENYDKKSGYSFTYHKDDVSLIKEFANEKYNIVAFHPPLVKQILTDENIDEIADGKCNELPIPYITEQKNYIYDLEYIYDYSYHLNKVGRENRTRKLATDLLTFIDSSHMLTR